MGSSLFCFLKTAGAKLNKTHLPNKNLAERPDFLAAMLTKKVQFLQPRRVGPEQKCPHILTASVADHNP